MATIVPDGGQNIVEAETKPAAKGTSYQYRTILNRSDKDVIKIIYEIPKSAFVDGCWQKTWKKFCPCLSGKCSCCDYYKTLETQRQESECTWVMENRMEFNRPLVVPKNESSDICTNHVTWRVVDNVSVVYYDDEMYDHVVTENPFYHEIISSCCGSSGETNKFRKRCQGCPSTEFCSRTVLVIKVTEVTADKCVEIIKEACENAKAKMTP